MRSLGPALRLRGSGINARGARSVPVDGRPNRGDLLGMVAIHHRDTGALLLRWEGAAPDALARSTLRYADLRGARLAGVDLTGADLGAADLSGANLSGARLDAADLSGADLTDATLTGVSFVGGRMLGANLTGTDLTGADLTRATLKLCYRLARPPRFRDATMPNVHLGQVALPGGDWTGADLTEAILAQAQLAEASFVGASLRSAALATTDLAGSDLRHADLSFAMFREAALANCRFGGAILGKTTVVACPSLADAAELDHVSLIGPIYCDLTTAAALTEARRAALGLA